MSQNQKNNPLALHVTIVHALPGLDMSSPTNDSPMIPKAPNVLGNHKLAFGIKGPWSINPGNPDFPNHRPYLSNPKPPNEAAPAPSEKLKFS